MGDFRQKNDPKPLLLQKKISKREEKNRKGLEKKIDD